MHLGGTGDLAGQPVGERPNRQAILPCYSSPVLGVEAVGGTDAHRFLDSRA
jgi:hypothetical protein